MKERMKEALMTLVMAAFAAGVAASFLFALGRLEAGNESESRDQLERSLRRAIAAEYAISGAYPEALDSIVSKYGIQIDYDRFDVFYMPVAENLAPELDIVDKEGIREGGSLH